MLIQLKRDYQTRSLLNVKHVAAIETTELF